jgi:homospermidine synthase
LDKSIENDIINNYYDVIIYGSINRGCPFIELVKNKYENNKIIFLDGEDHNDIIYKDDSKYNLFIRELYV